MTSETNWTRITKIEDIPLFEGRSVRVDGVELAIFNLGGRFAAIENQCPHQGGPLCDGIVSDTTVVCPLHGWGFDLNTGLAARASLPVCVAVFATRVEDGIILVDVGHGSRIEPEEAVA
jgi:NAD(P)H-dependent nitrite reductase small subunit